jgi:hypothetical protein
MGMFLKYPSVCLLLYQRPNSLVEQAWPGGECVVVNGDHLVFARSLATQLVGMNISKVVKRERESWES